jgi:ABC-type multidrug transport system fused ATPase/permease subunit
MENPTVTLKGNQKCAIIGKTGAGKSTTATALAEI